MKKAFKFNVRNAVFLIFILCFLEVSAEGKTSERKRPESLPFDVSEEQRISEDDLKNKPEGWYPVILPVIAKDETLGNFYGANLNFVNNGSRSNSLFEYTPYRDSLNLAFIYSDLGMRGYYVDYLKKYIKDTPYSVQFSGGYQRITNFLYMGLGSETMNSLSGRELNDPRKPQIYNMSFDSYSQNLQYRRNSQGNPYSQYETDAMYNRYISEFSGSSINIDRIIFRVIRLIGGTSFSRNIVRTYDGKAVRTDELYFPDSGSDVSEIYLKSKLYAHTMNGRTKLTEDFERGKIAGFHGGYDNAVRLGISLDRRDFSVDPTKGYFLELAHDRSLKLIGSDFEYNKTFGQARFYARLFPAYLERTVLALRAGIVSTKGSTPFFSYPNMNVTENYMVGLGGGSTLRGYQLSRFVGPVMGIANIEIRSRFASFSHSDHYFTFHFIPFYDIGRVWDRFSKVSSTGYAASYGIGLQISYNLSSVFRLDLAKSREDSTVNLQMMHPF